MKPIFAQSLMRTTYTSEEKITVTVQEHPNFGGFHLSYGGMKKDWKHALTASPIVGEIEGSPYPTAEIAIAIAKEVIERQIKAGYLLDDEDEEPPSHNGGFQTHVRMMPPRK